MESLASPFGVEPLTEIPLGDAPLARVLTQVRFPPDPEIGTEGGVERFRRALRPEYPVYRPDTAVGLLVTPSGIQPHPESERIWRFRDADEVWQVSIAESFVAIDTARYTSREAFSERVQRVIRQVEVDFHPARFDRVGVRYVNRLQGSMTDDLGALIHPDLLSGLSIPRGDNVTMSLSLTQSIFRVGDITLTARWGLLPAGATVDPLIEATPDPSWILDLDAAYESGGRFGVELIGAHVRSAAAVCYRFFRWAVTAEYIGRAGGST